MDILIIGGGGREHALAWKAAQSSRVDTVYVAPGNAGTAREPGVENVDIAADDIDGLKRFALDKEIGLTIVGPEAPLVAGVVDAFIAAGLPCFGPGKQAARLEGSKSFAKDFMARHGIPTAGYAVFSELDAALAHLDEKGVPIVVKADGLAAGKGVIVATDRDTAEQAIRDMLAGNAFGEAGHRVVLEEYLEGEEASFIVMADGEHVLPMVASQDHKRVGEADTGPNTGGMGACSPAPVVTPEVHERIMKEIIEPTIAGMKRDGRPYVGFLYAGLMIAPDGAPRVIEFNCRMGDPETQPVLMRMQSDLVAHCLAALEGRLHEEEAAWDRRAALGVVLAAGGYPGKYTRGLPIRGLPVPGEEPGDCKIFHAGTRLAEGDVVVTDGGRVLCVTALGDSLRAARDRAYAAVGDIGWDGMFYRRDIGHRAIAREAAE